MSAALVYFFAVLSANFTATLFVPFPVFGQLAIGTLFFGLTFTQRDRLHQKKGRTFVYAVILGTALVNFACLLSYKYLWHGPWLSWLENWEWAHQGFAILAESSWRVLLASFVAIVLSETADTEMYHRLRRRSWLARVIRSNAVSIPLDTLIFNLLAFAGLFPWKVLLGILFGEVVVKYAIGLAYGLALKPAADKPIKWAVGGPTC